MKRIKQSFVEVVAGEPRKEHFINVSIVILVISVAVWVVLELTQFGKI